MIAKENIGVKRIKMALPTTKKKNPCTLSMYKVITNYLIIIYHYLPVTSSSIPVL